MENEERRNRNVQLRYQNRGAIFTQYIDQFQKMIITVLTWLMALIVFLSTINLIYILAEGLITPPFALLQIDELLSLFGAVLLVLIGVELLETFKEFQRDRTVNVMIVLMVALIAAARKAVLMEMNASSEYVTALGLSAIILSLSLAYYLIRKSTIPSGS